MAWRLQEELENRGLGKVNWEWSRVEQLALPLQPWRSLPGWGGFAVVQLLWGSPVPLLVTPYPRFVSSCTDSRLQRAYSSGLQPLHIFVSICSNTRP